MSLLDEAINNAGLTSGMDQLQAKVAKSIQRASQRTQLSPVQPMEYQGASFDNNTAVGSNQTYVDNRTLNNAGALSYLDQQLEAHWKRKEEQKDLWTSDDNLYSTNPFVEAGSNILNTGKRVASGIGQMFTGIAAGSAEAQRNAINASIPQDIQDIARRQKNSINRNSTMSEIRSLENQLKHGQLDEREQAAVLEQMGQLQLRLNDTAPTEQELARLKESSQKHGGRSWQEILKDRDAMDLNARRIRGDSSKGIESALGAENWGNRIADENVQMTVDKDRIKASADEARALWDQGNVGAAAAQTLKTWGTQLGEYGSAALQNPGAITGMIADSAVYMNPITRIPGAVGLAGEQYAKGSQEIRDENNREMTGGEHAGVGALAAAMGGLGFVQGKLEQSALMGQVGGTAARGSKAIVGGIADGASAISRATIGKTPYVGGVLDMAVKGAGAVAREATPIAGRIAATAGMEGAVEGVQSVIEQNAGLQGNFNIEETGENIALGAVTGGAIAAPGAVVQTGVDLVSSKIQKKNEAEVGRADVTDEELLNANSAAYNPTQLINREIRKATQVGVEVTPEEIEASKQKVDAAYAATKKAYDNSSAVIDAVNNYDKVIADHTAWLGRMEARVEAKRDEGEEAYQQARAFVDSVIAPRQAFIDSVIAAKEAGMDGLVARNEKDKKLYEDATKSYQQFDKWYQNQQQPAAANTTPATPVEEATKILGAPSFGDVKRMQQLANDGSLEEEVRTRLRVVSDALIAENKAKNLGNINKAIMKGVPGYRGMAEYMALMTEAVNTNDVSQQNILTRQLNSFASSLNSKVTAAKLAQEEANKQGRMIQVVRDTAGNWQAITEGTVPSSEFDKNNGLKIWPVSTKNPNGSNKLISAMTDNLEAVQGTTTAIELMKGSTANPAAPSVDENNFDAALDAFNADERANGRDTSFRDNDPNAVTVENNEGDLIDNSTPQEPAEDTTAEQLQPEVEKYSDKEGWSKVNTKSQTKDVYSRTEGDTERVVHVDKETGEVTKDELRTSPKTVVADPETGEEFTFKIYRDSSNPDVITNVRLYSNGEMVETLGKQGRQSDDQFIKDYVESKDLELLPNSTEAKPKAEAKPEADKVKADAKKPAKKTEKPKKVKKVVEADVPVKTEIQEEKATYTESEYAESKSETVARTDADRTTLADGSVDSSPAGALATLNTNGKSYKEAIAEERSKALPNLVKAGFVQRLKAGLNSPLLKYPNLMSILRANMRGKDAGRVIAGFIGKNSTATPTEANVARVIDFFKFAANFNSVLAQQIRTKSSPEYFHESMLDYLYVEDANGNKVLEENVATAMSLGAYEWLSNNAKVVAGTTQEIAAKIYMPDAKELPSEVYQALGGVGTYHHEVIKELGQSALKALQLKALPDVDGDLGNKLTMAMGAFTLAGLLNAELVQRTDVPLAVIQDLQKLTQELNGEEDSGNTSKPMGSVYFIRPAVQLNKQGELIMGEYGPMMHPRINQISQMKTDAASVLSKVFNYQDEAALPSAEPITTLPATIDRLGTQLSDFQKEVMLKQQATPYALNTELVDAYYTLKELDETALSEILGFKNPKDGLEIREKSVQSRNEQISRSLAFLEMTYNEHGDGEFYLPLSVWTNMRSGITSVFNPQADKLHRAFSALSSDKITVPHDETRIFDEQGELTKYGMFLRGLAFRMEDAKMDGVDGSIDKKNYATFLPQFETYLNSAEVKNAAIAMTAVKAGEATKEDVAVVRDLLVKWGNGAAGLSALDAIAKRDIGRILGEDFDSYIFAESDGSNNGPAITHTMMNTGSREMMNSVGIFFDEDGVTNLADYRTVKDGRDMYEQLADYKAHFLNQSLEFSENAGVLDQINSIDSDFASRKGAKRDLVPFNYGAGMDAVKRASSRAFLEVVYNKLEAAVVAESVEGVDNLVQQLNPLIQYYNQATGSKTALLDARNLYGKHAKLSPAQERAIRAVEEQVRGPVTEMALNDMLGDYINTRNQFATISGTSYDLFMSMYNEEMGVELQKYYRENPEAKRRGESLPTAVRDGVIRRLRRYMPKLDVAMGLHNKQRGVTAIPVVDTAINWQTKGVRVPFKRAAYPQFSIKDTSGLTYVGQSKAGNGDISSAIEGFDIAAPGVGSIAKYIQSHDAYVAHRTMEKFKVQNYHDANPINPYQLIEMAQYQNEAFLDAVTTSHIGESFLNALMAPLQAYAEGLVTPSKANWSTYLASMSRLKKSFNIPKETDDLTAIRHIARTLLGEDVRKMKQIVHAKAINQYGTEGGEYLLTDAKRKQIVQRTDSLIDRSKKLITKLESLAQAMQQLPKTAPARNMTVGEIRRAQLTAVSEPGREATPAETELWMNRETLKDPREFVKFVDQQVAQHLSKEGNVGKYANVYRQLLRVTKSSLEGLEINIFSDVEDTSNIAGYDQAIQDGVSAWYINKDGKRQINIRMGTNQKINSAVLVHELMHAATADALAIMRKDPSKYPKAQQAYSNLEALYQHVKTQVQDGDSQLVKYGVSNLDEFIATGLTYPQFMQFLDNIKSVPKAKGRGLSNFKPGSMLRAVVDNLLTVMRDVFGKGGSTFNVKTATAYEALVLDVAQFMQGTTNIEKDNDTQVSLLGAPTAKALDETNRMTAVEVYDSLNAEGVDPTFDGQVRNIITSVSDKVLSRLPKDYKGTNNFSPENIWNHALETGEAPYQSPAIDAGFKLSDREQFAVEALELTLEATMKDKSLTTVMKELEVVYDNAKAKIKPEHLIDVAWADASAEQKAVAEAKHKYLFDSRNKAYLPRFMAMALGSAEVNSLLGFNVNKKGLLRTDKELFNRVFKYADKAVDSLVNKHLGSTSPLANERLNAIALKFVDLDNKNRNKAMAVIEHGMAQYDYHTNRAGRYVMGKAADVALATKPTTQAGKIIRNTVGATLGGKPMEIFTVFDGLRNQTMPNTTLGFLGELNKEVGNVTKEQQTAEALIREQKTHETHAQRLRNEIKHDLLDMFKEGGKNLDKEAREAITAGLLRTDVQALTGTYSMNQIADMVKSRTALKAEIAKLSKGVSPMHLARVKMLAWYQVSGIGHNLLAKNVYAIAAGAGLGTPTKNVKAPYVKQLDQLASLYALSYTDSNKLNTLAQVIDAEQDGKSYGGIEAVLKYHAGLVNDSRNHLFNGSEMNMTKGYMPEITNHHKDVVVATTQADADRLRAAMYKELGEANKDPNDPTGFTPVLFYTEDSTKQQYISGAMALYNYGSKGRDLDLDPREIADISNAARSKTFDANWDPRQETDGSMIPLYDTDGMLTGYRYEMSHHKRDTYLERNNDFSDLIGAFTSLGYTKMANKAQNEKVVDSLLQDWQNAKAVDRAKYVYVSYESTDKAAYDAWQRLSHETKEYVKSTWGEYGMWVSNDAFLTVFGHPKVSMFTGAFDKDIYERNVVEELYVTAMKGIFGEKSRVAAARTERMWQEMVSLTKNFVVIRNVSTMVMNMAANTFLLMAHGVPITDLIKNTKDSMKGGMQYRKDIALLTRLEARQRSGVGDPVEVQDQINRLRNRIEANPMYEFISAGMFAGIVEDIDPSQDMYSYQSGLQRKFEKVYNKVPKLVRRTAEYAFVTPSTPLYQFLHSATQYSDFSAKYVLYKHLSEKADKKLSKEDALQEASNNFINYDVPTSPWMQYANDMGLVMFTKYNLRIQKALFKLIAERPASAIGQAIAMQAVTSLPPGLDPIVFNQYGNPFRDGAFGFFGVWDEPFPIKALF